MPTTGPQNWPEHVKNWRRGFWSLIATQFQGAFNDNGLKFFVIYLILGQNPTTAQKDFGVFLIGNLFVLPGQSLSGLHGNFPGQHASRIVRAIQVWPASGVAACRTLVVGEWRSRTDHIYRDYLGHRGGLVSGAAISRQPRDRRNDLWCLLTPRSRRQLSDHSRAGRRSNQEIQVQYFCGFARAAELGATGSCAEAGDHRQYLFLVSRRAAAICDRFLWPRDHAPERNARKLFASRAGDRHRSGEFCRGLSLRRKNRIRIDSAGRRGYGHLRLLVVAAGVVVCAGLRFAR